jgi:hypothetical protein
MNEPSEFRVKATTTMSAVFKRLGVLAALVTMTSGVIVAPSTAALASASGQVVNGQVKFQLHVTGTGSWVDLITVNAEAQYGSQHGHLQIYSAEQGSAERSHLYNSANKTLDRTSSGGLWFQRNPNQHFERRYLCARWWYKIHTGAWAYDGDSCVWVFTP